jgi:hypothetical protein
MFALPLLTFLNQMLNLDFQVRVKRERRKKNFQKKEEKRIKRVKKNEKRA